MDICIFRNYNEIFGVIGKGIHGYRFLDTAVVDYISTIVVACLTTYYSKIPLVLTTIMWFVIAIILHALFGVETNEMKYLGIKC